MAEMHARSIAHARERIMGPARRKENSMPSGVSMISVFSLLWIISALFLNPAFLFYQSLIEREAMTEVLVQEFRNRSSHYRVLPVRDTVRKSFQLFRPR